MRNGETNVFIPVPDHLPGWELMYHPVVCTAPGVVHCGKACSHWPESHDPASLDKLTTFRENAARTSLGVLRSLAGRALRGGEKIDATTILLFDCGGEEKYGALNHSQIGMPRQPAYRCHLEIAVRPENRAPKSQFLTRHVPVSGLSAVPSSD